MSLPNCNLIIVWGTATTAEYTREKAFGSNIPCKKAGDHDGILDESDKIDGKKVDIKKEQLFICVK